MNARPLITAGTVLGIGLGGFIDGILLHQLLQVHNMLSAIRPKDTLVNTEINMFWDGLFHAVCLGFTITGVVLLFRAAAERSGPWTGRMLFGTLIFGWGIFNVVEGIIDHYLLGIHHVIEQRGLSGWDHGFVGGSVLLVVIGAAMIRSELKRADRGERPRPDYREPELTMHP